MLTEKDLKDLNIRTLTQLAIDLRKDARMYNKQNNLTLYQITIQDLNLVNQIIDREEAK